MLSLGNGLSMVKRLAGPSSANPRSRGRMKTAETRSEMAEGLDFRAVIGRFVTGVTVVTCDHEGRRYGTTASAVSSVSLSPPTVLVCMDRGSDTRSAVLATGVFALNILHEGQEDLALGFARKIDSKFDGIEVVRGRSGAPLLPEALGHLECRLVDTLEAATHTILVARVEYLTGVPGRPLAHFGGDFVRLGAEHGR